MSYENILSIPNRILINSDQILHNCRLPNESDRSSFEYNEPLNFPIYFELGRLLNPNRLLFIGDGIGLHLASFIAGCNKIESLTVWNYNNEKSQQRLLLGNISNFYNKKVKLAKHGFDNSEYDVILLHKINEFEFTNEFRNFVWERLVFSGLLFIDFVKPNQLNCNFYHNFCYSRNRDIVIMNSVYGLGLLEK